VIFYETFRVALRSLRTHPLRTFLTLLGVIIGVMTVVTVVSIIGGLNRYVREKVLTLGVDVFIVSKMGIITSRDQLLQAIRRKEISLEEYEAIARLCGDCGMVGGSVTSRKAVRHEAERLPDVTVTGATANMLELGALDVELGRFLSEPEVGHSRPVAVIGSDVRDELFPGVDPIGRRIKIDDTPYKVVGLLAKKGSVFGETQDKLVYVPLTTFIKNFGPRRSVEIYVKSGSGTRMERVQDEVRAILRGLRHTSYHDKDPFDFVTSEAMQGLWSSISVGAFSLMIFISAISLVVGGIVIMNIMLVSVAERTHEIGVRMALGARRATIRLQFLLEAALMALAGGAVGVGIGAAIGAAIEAFSPLPVSITLPVVFGSLGLAATVGIVSGVVPSVKASRLSPVEALRQEK
jgi:putative ABC transport system permease protein